MPEAAASSESEPKPRLLFVRPDRLDLPPFIRQHLDEHVTCLGQFFDVVLAEGDGDLAEYCDRYEPDGIFVESGAYARRTRRWTGLGAHPQIPRLGFVDADAYDVTRSVFLSDMDDWGIDAFVTISMTMAAHTPDIADRLYVWPNFADSSLYHTYPGEKTVPVLLTGSVRSNYPWRAAVSRALADAFEVRSLPHGGWFDPRQSAGMVSGEPYARQLSQSLIVPTCGTIAHEFVRKHAEIPASGACLVTERTRSLELAGFVDMENCVFADEDDVVDKVWYLLDNPDELARITANGQRLAHLRHDIRNRNQVRQWFDLTRGLGPGERIEQPDPFGDLVVRGRPARPTPVTPVLGGSRDVVLLARAHDELAGGRPGIAKDTYRSVLALHYLPEAALGLARACLAQGQARRAEEWLWTAIRPTVVGHGATSPDPVEWAYLLRAVLCQGNLSRAFDLAGVYPALRHPELRRTWGVLSAIAGRPIGAPDAEGTPRRGSVHDVRAEDERPWRDRFADDLRASGREQWAALVTTASLVPAAVPPTSAASRPPVELRRRLTDRVVGRLQRELARLFPAPPRDVGLDAALGGRGIGLVVTAGVGGDEPTVRALAEIVRSSPDRPGWVTLGLGSSRGDDDPGLTRSALLALVGSGVALACGPAAGELLEADDLAQTTAVILVGLDDARQADLATALDAASRHRRTTLPGGAAVWVRSPSGDPSRVRAGAGRVVTEGAAG
jgi:hypothetical protein